MRAPTTLLEVIVGKINFELSQAISSICGRGHPANYNLATKMWGLFHCVSETAPLGFVFVFKVLL